jgi:hypothetical protein
LTEQVMWLQGLFVNKQPDDQSAQAMAVRRQPVQGNNLYGPHINLGNRIMLRPVAVEDGHGDLRCTVRLASQNIARARFAPRG